MEQDIGAAEKERAMEMVPIPLPRPESPFSAAVRRLREAGYTVAPADPPFLGLTNVSGVRGDLTMAQVMSVAASLPTYG
jgi:hypothetical protein